MASLAFLVGAEDPWTDASTHDLHGYVRALSLDLRGIVPTADELIEIEEAGSVSEEMLDVWLTSTEFEEQVISRHRDFFWNQLEINLLQRRKIFKRDGIYFSNQRAQIKIIQSKSFDLESNLFSQIFSGPRIGSQFIQTRDHSNHLRESLRVRSFRG